MSHLTSCTNGGKTVASRTFLMTRTVRGGLYQVKRWLAGSWIVLCKDDIKINERISPKTRKNDGAARNELIWALPLLLPGNSLIGTRLDLHSRELTGAACAFGEPWGNTLDKKQETRASYNIPRPPLSSSTCLLWSLGGPAKSAPVPDNAPPQKWGGERRRVVVRTISLITFSSLSLSLPQIRLFITMTTLSPSSSFSQLGSQTLLPITRRDSTCRKSLQLFSPNT